MYNLKILVVDDDPITLLLLEKRLKKEEYDIVTAKNGTEAIALISRDYFDVVVTDLKMPGGLDGIDVLEASKAVNNRTEVILITAHATVDTAVAAMKKGASDYLQKPINFDELMIRLGKISNMKQLVKNADDLREAMDITERSAGETIQNLEITVAQLQNRLSDIESVLAEEGLDSVERIQKALSMFATT
jgi:two-component system, OmpR family, response regulator